MLSVRYDGELILVKFLQREGDFLLHFHSAFQESLSDPLKCLSVMQHLAADRTLPLSALLR